MIAKGGHLRYLKIQLRFTDREQKLEPGLDRWFDRVANPDARINRFCKYCALRLDFESEVAYSLEDLENVLIWRWIRWRRSQINGEEGPSGAQV